MIGLTISTLDVVIDVYVPYIEKECAQHHKPHCTGRSMKIIWMVYQCLCLHVPTEYYILVHIFFIDWNMLMLAKLDVVIY
jgi:hypothetical protein